MKLEMEIYFSKTFQNLKSIKQNLKMYCTLQIYMCECFKINYWLK